jgi:dTDP-4-dehydrorhamnose 3,5-epimerase-like enzyme
MKVLRRPIGFLEGPPGPELEKAVPLAKEIANTIRVLYYKIELVGTIRRKKATVGNIDFVIITVDGNWGLEATRQQLIRHCSKKLYLLYVLIVAKEMLLTLSHYMELEVIALSKKQVSALSQCKVICFPKMTDTRGNLSFIEENKHVPFETKRIFYLYDLPSGSTRGGHANKMTKQVIIALSGSFEVVLDDGFERKSFFLNMPHQGLYLPPGVWKEMKNFSSNSIVLVLASSFFDENDYMREYETFKKIAWRKKNRYYKFTDRAQEMVE